MTTVTDLADLESIKLLKARYFRFTDTKNWDGLASLFTDDAVFDVGLDLGDGGELLDKPKFMSLARATLSECTSVHQGYMPELEITSPTTAKGIWAMSDYLDYHGAPGPLPGGGSVIRGYGHYHEEYVKENGAWRISSYRMTRLKVDEFPGPGSVPGT